MAESSNENNRDSVFINLKDGDEFVQAAGLQRTKFSGRKSSVEKMLEETFNTSGDMSLHSDSSRDSLRSHSPMREPVSDSLSSDEYISAAGLNKTSSMERKVSSRERLLEESLGTTTKPASPNLSSLRNSTSHSPRSQSPAKDHVREDLSRDEFIADAGLRKTGSVSGRKSSKEKLLEESLGTSSPRLPMHSPFYNPNSPRSRSPIQDHIGESLSSDEYVSDAGLRKSRSASTRKSSKERLLEESLQTSKSLPSSPRLSQGPRLSSSTSRLSPSPRPQRSPSPSAERLRESLTTDEFLYDAGLKKTSTIINDEVSLEQKREIELRNDHLNSEQIEDKQIEDTNTTEETEENKKTESTSKSAQQNVETEVSNKNEENKTLTTLPCENATDSKEKNMEKIKNNFQDIDNKVSNGLTIQNEIAITLGDSAVETKTEEHNAASSTNEVLDLNKNENVNGSLPNVNVDTTVQDTDNSNRKESVNENSNISSNKSHGRSSVYQLKQINAPTVMKGSKIAARTQHLFQQYDKDLNSPDIKATVNVKEEIGDSNIGIKDRKMSYAKATTDVHSIPAARTVKNEELDEVRRLHQLHVKDLEQETLSRK